MRKTEKSVLFDLVCGMALSEFEGEPVKLKYHGKVYYFCSDTCRHHFKSDPEKYLLTDK